ncbi:MAG TPA: glycosyltransferase N-terminal domain-containing protein [Longimicrobiales bacterium]
MTTLRERLFGTAITAAVPLVKLAARGESKLARGVRARDGAADRLIEWQRMARDPARPVAWMHAPSVGEALMAKAISGALRVRVPDVHVVFTCFSPSAERVLDSVGADVAGYLPWDTPGHVGRAVRAIAPDVVACVRTEVWPYFARVADEAGAGIALVNAVLSDASGRMRGPARWLLEPTYRRLDAVGVVSADDEPRFRRMGVPPERIRLTGDARFDQVWQRVGSLRSDSARLTRMRALVPEGRPVIVAGSTWPQDERHLVNALRWLANHAIDAVCIIAPHEPTPDHLTRLETRVAHAGLASARMAQVEQGAPLENVMLVDRVGVLADLYAIADVAYVGGGFHDEGLHSVVEPAALGVPVVFGPRLGNSREAAALARARGGVQVDGSGGLASALRRMIAEPAARGAAGSAALAFVQERLGGADRNAALLAELIETRARRQGTV